MYVHTCWTAPPLSARYMYIHSIQLLTMKACSALSSPNVTLNWLVYPPFSLMHAGTLAAHRACILHHSTPDGKQQITRPSGRPSRQLTGRVPLGADSARGPPPQHQGGGGGGSARLASKGRLICIRAAAAVTAAPGADTEPFRSPGPPAGPKRGDQCMARQRARERRPPPRCRYFGEPL